MGARAPAPAREEIRRSMSGAGARVLLIDLGELDDVARLLEGLGADLVRARPDGVAALPPRTNALLVTTARDGLALPCGVAEAPVRVVVASDGSRTLRGALRRAGFDYLLHRPVHPEALRLFLARLVYRGPEKRRAPRVAVGTTVTYRTGLRRQEAILVDLSLSGCRLLCRNPQREGGRLALQLAEPDGTRPWSLSGTIARRAAPSPVTPGVWSVAVVFGTLAPELRDRLGRWLVAHQAGPASWRGAPVPGLVLPADEAREERSGPRRAYAKRVIALAESGARVLLARDLSSGGLRVEGAPGLAPGARVRVALHGSPLPGALVLSARVTRRGVAGDLVLRFEDVDAATSERLAKLLADQPEIEALGPGRGGTRRRLVARLLGRG
jgi:hypothetical protein